MFPAGRTLESSSSRLSKQLVSRVLERGVKTNELYSWVTDFPLSLQSDESKEGSEIILEFALGEGDLKEFSRLLESKLNGNLPLLFKFGRDSVDVSIAKQGRGQKTLNAKIDRILTFCAARVCIEYIPAVRTAERAHDIVRAIVSRELRQIENKPQFKQALRIVADLQEPILRQLGEKIEVTVKGFLPSLKSVKIKVQGDRRLSALRSTAEILLNDGVETPLQFKGDGVQSLVALAVMRHAASNQRGKSTIIALEEPESHLHPKAIREIKQVLDELSHDNQVLITTHNPLFVGRLNVSGNIIVNDSKAFPANSIEEIREALGVHVSDNLQGAELILLVEGFCDEQFLRTAMASYSKHLRSAMESNRLAIDRLDGGSKLHYKVSLHRLHLCAVHAYLDNDASGLAAFEKCKSDTLLELSEVQFATCPGLRESELEDLYLDELTSKALSKDGVDWSKAKKRKLKWSDKVSKAFSESGKPFGDAQLKIVKKRVLEEALKLGMGAVHTSKASSLIALFGELEKRLKPKT